MILAFLFELLHSENKTIDRISEIYAGNRVFRKTNYCKILMNIEMALLDGEATCISILLTIKLERYRVINDFL